MADAAELIVAVFSVILLTGTSLVANGCVFVAFCRNKHIRTVDNYFFLTLSFGNTVVGLCFPAQCLVDVGILNHRPACLPLACILLVFALIIAWSIVALTVERYLTIIRPLTVRQILTERCTACIISLIVLYAIVGGAVVPAVLSANYFVAPSVNASTSTPAGTDCRLYTLIPSRGYRLFYLANRVLTIPIFIGIYLHIFFITRRHMRAIAEQVTQPIRQACPTPSSNNSSSSRERHLSPNFWRREIKLTLLVFTIALHHSLCWIPQSVLLLQSRELPSIYYTLTHFFTYTSTTLYPVIYGIGNRNIREVLISHFRCRNRVNSSGGIVRTGSCPTVDGRSRHNARCRTIAESSGAVQMSSPSLEEQSTE